MLLGQLPPSPVAWRRAGMAWWQEIFGIVPPAALVEAEHLSSVTGSHSLG